MVQDRLFTYKKQQNIANLIMKAAATFLTRGHLRRATIVRRFPRIPTTMIKTVMVAAKSSKGLENLQRIKINSF
jgi:hypothetical protein